MLDRTCRDFIYAARVLRKNPAFTLTAVLTLALGIGGNTAMFTVVRSVLLKPLDYPNSDQLIHISGGATPTRFEGIRANARSFSGIAAYTLDESLTLTGNGEPAVLKARRVSANFLSVLGQQPIVGRSFLASEDAPDGTPVVLISSELWIQRLNHDPQVAGKTLNLSGTSYTVIGVLPPRFHFPSPGLDVWLTRPDEWSLMPAKSRRLSPILSIFGRLNSHVTLQQANAELVLIHHRYVLEHPAMLDAKSPEEAKLMKDELVTDVRSILWMLFGAVGFVLLITCANVASLMLSRAKSRSREFAVRAAIGASRWCLISHLLAESLLLSSAGGILGVLFATLSLRAVPLMTDIDLPRTAEIHVDWPVLAFAAALSVATGLLFGLLPSLNASRPDLIAVLRGTGAAATKERLNVRNLLVVTQVAFSIVLLIGATLMIESVLRLRDVNVGFNPASLLTARLSMPPNRYDTPLKQSLFIDDLVARLSSSPGVRSAAAGMTLPMMASAGTPIQDAAQPPLRLNQRPIVTIGVVTPGYFRTLQIPIRRGRDFTLRDRKESERVAIIDEALARRFWPLYPSGIDPINQRLLIGGVNLEPARIVGIVPSVHQNLGKNVWREMVYVSFNQAPQPMAMLAVRGDGDPHRLAHLVQDVTRTLDRDLPISDVRSMEERVDGELGQRRVVVWLLLSFASVALCLALIGIYGTISYSIAQRIQELGIRKALGAQPADILRLVVGQGFVFAVIGIAIGIGGSLWLTQALKSLLFEVSATDPATFVGIAVLFLLATLIASYIPARRAARLDPMAALRV
jgi:predicted permease